MSNRDLKQYFADYINLPFEPILIDYRKRKVLEFLNKYQPKSILEIGCGLDPTFKYYQKFENFVVVEPTEQFYKNAEILSSQSKLPVLVLNNFFENCSEVLLKIEFDFIIVSCLLHELDNIDVFMKQLLKVCTSKTIIHVNVPNSFSFHRILAIHAGIIKSEMEISDTQIVMQQKQIFSIASLSHLVASYSFKILESGSYFIKPFTHLQMQQLVDSSILTTEILDGLYSMTEHLPEMGAEIYVNFNLN
jgi:SAM-dependent methyltransferase